MKTNNCNHRISLGAVFIFVACAAIVAGFGGQALAQQKAGSAPARAGKLGAAAQTSQASADQEAKPFKFAERDSPELIRKREEWFYKQRAFPNKHIPAGARLRAFQQMQQMMEREGKLVRQPDGTFTTVTPSITLGGTWTSLGPAPTTGGIFSPVSGRVEAIAVDPSDTTGNTVLVGGAQGGIWQSTDGGTTWAAKGDTNPSLAMGSIAFAPSACTASPGACTVYAGTGEQADIGFDIYYGAGVLKSTDHGQHWTQTCTMASSTCPFIGPFTNTLNFGFFNDGGARISYIAVNPSNDKLVLVGAQIPRVGGSLSETAGGIYCSDDGGATWRSLLLGGAGSFVGFANAMTAYAALGRPFGSTGPSANGIYRSTTADGGPSKLCSAITFTPTGTQPTNSAMGRIDAGIAASDSTGNTLYVSVADATTSSDLNLGVWKTTDGGATWTKTNAPDVCRLQCWFDNVVKVDPNNPNTVFIGGSAVADPTGQLPGWVLRSTDGGTSWSTVLPGTIQPGLPHQDVHALTFFKAASGKVLLYMGNDGGVWNTTDAEAPNVTWSNGNTNLTLTQFYPNLSFSSANPNLLYAGAQDNGSQFYNGGVSWINNGRCGDGGQTAVDFLIPTVVYATCQFIDINVSPSGGQNPSSFTLSVNGIALTDRVDFIPPISADPSTPGRAYFGTNRVYQTNDFGNNWTAISGPLPGVNFELTTIAAAPKNPAVVYAGSDDGGVFVAANVGAGTMATFNSVGGGTLPARNVTAVVPDPNDSTGLTAFVTFSGFAIAGTSDTKNHIFKTANGGGAWTDVSAGLPNIPVNDLVVDPDVAGTLYAATDLGVFFTSDGGATWGTVGTGLPNVAVLSLRLHEPSRTLLATTHGRGAWSLALDTSIFAGKPHISELTPATANAGVAPATITVSGSGFAPGGVVGAVNWDGSTMNVTPQPGGTDMQLQATIAGSLLAAGGTHQITVTAGTPAQTSNALIFSVLGAAPVLNSIMPTSTPVQPPAPAGPVTITLNGSSFVSGMHVFFDGAQNGITTSQGGSCLPPSCTTATLPAALLGPFGGTHDITAVNPPPGGGRSSAVTFVVQAPAPVNDNFANALNIPTNAFTDTKDSSGATTETSDPTPPCVIAEGFPTNGRSNTIWYKFTASGGGTITADTNNSLYDTVLSAWTGSAGNLTAVPGPGACNDDIVLGVVLTSQISFTATSGTTYFIMVSSFGPPDPNPIALGGKSVLNFTFAPTPDFTLTPQAPMSVTVNAGSPASFTIAVGAQGGFSSSVNFTCSLPPAAAHTTCTVNPPSQTPGNNVTANVTTTARGLAPPAAPWRVPPRPIFLPLLALVAALLILLAKVKARRLRLALSLPLATVFLLLVFQAAGCGGGGGGGGGGTTGTPVGTYTVTVTGTSGGTSHNTTVTLIVN